MTKRLRRDNGCWSSKPANGKIQKNPGKILRGTSDANIAFDDLRNVLLRLEFEERTKGSHHIFRKPGIEEKPNLQRDGSNAKPYQVRQVRRLITKYHLSED